ncbi:MAG: hypothetical protein CSA23_05600 [Deltaproteobacteria bacterium]|nr:MAG: hypothetical protein CSA23_05600 [Deltaproteobacteria bacterium]
MLQVSYQIFGIVFLILLGAIWWGKRIAYRRRPMPDDSRQANAADGCSAGETIEHRVLMYLMTQQTESILAALARTIEQERQKLGVIVRNPSVAAAARAFQGHSTYGEADYPVPESRIVAMAHKGENVSSIARQLEIGEEEVTMVMRLKGAAAA